MGKNIYPMRGLRINDELYLKLKKLAAEDSRSFNNYVTLVLQKHVAEYEAQHGEIEVDVDALYE